jgi:hypothetical protein
MKVASLLRRALKASIPDPALPLIISIHLEEPASRRTMCQPGP